MSVRNYGTPAGVAAYVKRFTSTGTFTAATTPTLAQVTDWIAQVSAQINVLLATEGFTVPVTQSDCVYLLTSFVETEVAERVKAVNGMGRFVNEKERRSALRIIADDAKEFIETNKAGFAGLGASQDVASLGDIQTRDADESGTEVNPIFQRKMFEGDNRSWDQ